MNALIAINFQNRRQTLPWDFFLLARNSGVSRDHTRLGASRVDHSKWRGEELRTARYWIKLFLGKIDHDDLRVFAQAVEDDLFSVACHVKGPHGGTVLQPGEGARLHGGEIE